MEDRRAEGRRPSRLKVLLLVAIVVSLALIGVAYSRIIAGPPPERDVRPQPIAWRLNETVPGSPSAGAGRVLGLSMSIMSSAADPRAERIYTLFERKVVAFDARDGNVRWTDSLAPDLGNSGPISVNYADYGQAPDYETYVGTANGSLRWYDDSSGLSKGAIALDGSVVGIAVFVVHPNTGRVPGDLVVAATSAGTVSRFYASNHTEAWRLPVGGTVFLAGLPLVGPNAVPTSSAAFAQSGHVLYLGTGAGEVFAVNASTGVVRWRSSLASTPSAGPVAFSTPALGDGVLVPTASGDAVFLTPNGSVRSTVHVSNAPVLIPATGSNLAVLAGEDGSVAGIALTVDPPVVEWVAPLLSAPSGTPALLESVAVAAADRGGRVYELASDGSLLFRMRVCDAVAGSPEMWSPKQALGKFIWIGCEDGSVLAIQANL